MAKKEELIKVLKQVVELKKALKLVVARNVQLTNQVDNLQRENLVYILHSMKDKKYIYNK